MREGEGGREGGRRREGEGEREISCAKILGHKILGSGLIRVSTYTYDQLSNGPFKCYKKLFVFKFDTT